VGLNSAPTHASSFCDACLLWRLRTGKCRGAARTTLGARVSGGRKHLVIKAPRLVTPEQAGVHHVRWGCSHRLALGAGQGSTERIDRTHQHSLPQSELTKQHARRFARLTNPLSVKSENLKAVLSLHFAWYNFRRVHSGLRVTPAMAANASINIWPLDRLFN
jgi:hypothetical protein